jgi:two-component system, chemotaxis family, protein-glutamate methylesterase/glutaminase
VQEFPVVLIGASVGALDAVRTITEALPARCKAAFAVVLHVGRYPSRLPDILNWHGKLPAEFAQEGVRLEVGRIFVAPPDRHMVLAAPGQFHLSAGTKVHNTRPAIDPLFISGAELYGRRVVGVVLSGASKDGAEGLRLIDEHGGLALVEDPVDAPSPRMPVAAIAANHPEVMRLDALARRVARFCADEHAALAEAPAY